MPDPMLAPRVIDDDEAGYGQVIGDGTVSEDSREQAEWAVVACPDRAICIDA